MSDVVQRAKAALEGVTEGPWSTYPSPLFKDARGVESVSQQRGVTSEAKAANAEFIAAARQLIPDLIAEVERLTPRRVETVAELDALPRGSVVANEQGAWRRSYELVGWLSTFDNSRQTWGLEPPVTVLFTPDAAL